MSDSQVDQPATGAPPDSAEAVAAELQRQPHILFKLAENTLTVANSLRDNYFKNTAKLVSDVRKAIREPRAEPILTTDDVSETCWADYQDEVVSFIDGGVGRVQISSQVPILLRVGSYTVKVGERQMAEREKFGYYPVVLGDLQGGSKDRKDFIDIVRITAELLGGLAALRRDPHLRVLMFHGPLVYLVWRYSGHTPFTESDIDLFLHQYTGGDGGSLKEEFLTQARVTIYPEMVPERADEWARRRVFEPLAWIAFLYRKLLETARQRTPVPIIAGVVERGELQEFSERILLARVFRGLRGKGNADHFNKLYGRTDLTSPRALLQRLNYTDGLLLAMILKPGHRSEAWGVGKYEGFRTTKVSLPGEAFETDVNFAALRGTPFGFPAVTGCYLHVSETTEPIRIEVFSELGTDQVDAAARRAYLYSRLLPNYCFPVGLDIVDKYAHVPAWMTSAYSKLIRFHLGVSLQQGKITDDEMRRLLVQAIYMAQRDWIFRPKA
ncbi:MAG: DNA double-strand break repair nuclease NurA [Zavarzinella sp.]|nr:DNA double-strand break repair nuclease NurA [Zavarzinella sp.]